MVKKSQKVIRDGKVAVLYSPGYGAGWWTWNTDYEWLLFHPDLVNAVEAKANEKKIEEIVNKLCKKFGIPEGSIYCGGVKTLTIKWLPEGTQFEVTDYNGYESIICLGERVFRTA